MLPQLTRFQDKALDLLFPRRCVGCGREGVLICESCNQLLPRILPPICSRCGRPQFKDVICPECVNWKATIAGFRAPFRFEDVIREAIHQLNYNNLRILAKPLAELLYDYIKSNSIQGDVLVPVPLHTKKLRQRGYNQSLLLARHLGEAVINGCLQRTRLASPQAVTATLEERRHNVSGAFSCRDRGVETKRILLIDDVCTSGATREACAEAFKAAGATSVWGITLAREI
ncbi:ComF family protein [Chloroflexota bacterium]